MKKDEEDFIKKITEIIESIKKGECTVPIKDVPEGKGEPNKNGISVQPRGSDGELPPISRSRAGSLKSSSKEEAIVEGSVYLKELPLKDSRMITDKKDVATSMSPITSLEGSRTKRKFEISEALKTPMISQTSTDSVCYC